MKNITVSVDEETHRFARIRAAELGTSVSALVRGYLRNLSSERPKGPALSEPSQESDFERRRRQMNDVIREITANGGGLRMSDNLSREELYGRDRARREARDAVDAERRERVGE